MPKSKHRKDRPKMKIPVRRIELKDMPDGGYDDEYWVEAPRSVTEGWFNELAQFTRNEAARRDPEKARDANLLVLGLITKWNLTDEDDKPLPLIKDLKTRKEKIAVLSKLPMDVVNFITKKTLGIGQNTVVPAQTQDF